MALSINSKLKDLMANPQAKEILAKNGFNVNEPQLKMAMSMSLKACCTFPGRESDPAILENIKKDLAAANLG